MADETSISSPVSTPDTLRNNDHIMDLGHGRHMFKWYDYQAPTPQELDALQQEYNLHPLAMEDVRTFDERAKVLDFTTYLFITVHSLTRHEGEMQDHEVEVFLARDWLITIHGDPMPEI